MDNELSHQAQKDKLAFEIAKLIGKVYLPNSGISEMVQRALRRKLNLKELTNLKLMIETAIPTHPVMSKEMRHHLDKVIQYNWKSEESDYAVLNELTKTNEPKEESGHIFYDLYQLNKFLNQ